LPYFKGGWIKTFENSCLNCPLQQTSKTKHKLLPEMETIDQTGFQLIGLKLKNKTSNEKGRSSIDCGNLWRKFEAEDRVQSIPGRIGEAIYAVYFDYEGDSTQPFSYFIGCKVKPDTEVPQGMDGLQIPPQQYWKITAKGIMPDCVANTWKEIWSSKIDREYRYDFEIYDERSKDWSNALVEIFISSK
jgi:predicted transcriptional regulator YdeE